ncbi:MAG: hypothetical protein QGF59_01375, partial [Pirellulaceae bacterium]|nr:hypothetical protein [Pirellulaceae bacterium]
MPVTILADDEVAKQRLRLLEDVYAKLKSGDSFEIVAQIESEGTPREIANKYLVLISGLYRNKFDVRKMLVIGRA